MWGRGVDIDIDIDTDVDANPGNSRDNGNGLCGKGGQTFVLLARNDFDLVSSMDESGWMQGTLEALCVCVVLGIRTYVSRYSILLIQGR